MKMMNKNEFEFNENEDLELENYLSSDFDFNLTQEKSEFGRSMHYKEVLKKAQEHLANKYTLALLDKNSNTRVKVESYLDMFLRTEDIGVGGFTKTDLIRKLYNDMTQYGFLTDYLENKDVEEININRWNDIKITYSDGRIEPAGDSFISESHARDIITRLLKESNMIIDASNPSMVGHLRNEVRITANIHPIVDKDAGVSASIRIVNPKKLKKEDFVRYNTLTGEMFDFLSDVYQYGASMCFTGETSSGKTTLLGAILDTLSDDTRIITIENDTREFDLVKYNSKNEVVNNVVHLITRKTPIDSRRENITQERLLEISLTMNPDKIVVGEMKSSEAFAAQEAARTGHGVATTIHANSCRDTYNRMVTLCITKYELSDQTLYKLVTEAFPIVIFSKQLADKSRKIMEITECVINPDGTRSINTLYRYKIDDYVVENGNIKEIKGHFEKVNEMSKNLQVLLYERGMLKEKLQKYVSEVNMYES